MGAGRQVEEIMAAPHSQDAEEGGRCQRVVASASAGGDEEAEQQ